MQAPPSPESQIVGSSSEPRREFQTVISSARLTLVLAGWIWGEPAPPPIESKRNDQSGSAEEVEFAGSSVRHAAHALEQLLRNAYSRIIPIVTGRSCVSGQKRFERSMALFRKFIGWMLRSGGLRVRLAQVNCVGEFKGKGSGGVFGNDQR